MDNISKESPLVLSTDETSVDGQTDDSPAEICVPYSESLVTKFYRIGGLVKPDSDCP
jgi:hypothetical protein